MNITGWMFENLARMLVKVLRTFPVFLEIKTKKKKILWTNLQEGTIVDCTFTFKSVEELILLQCFRWSVKYGAKRLSVDSPLGCLCVFHYPTVQTVDKPHAIAVHEECRSGTSKTKSLTCSGPLNFKNKVAKSQDSQMYCQALENTLNHSYTLHHLSSCHTCISTRIFISQVFVREKCFFVFFLMQMQKNDVMINHVLVKQWC